MFLFSEKNQSSSITHAASCLFDTGEGGFSGNKSSWNIKLITDFHLLSWLRISRFVPLFCHVPSWRAKRIYIYYLWKATF
jgi:hypothetical protein